MNQFLIIKSFYISYWFCFSRKPSFQGHLLHTTFPDHSIKNRENLLLISPSSFNFLCSFCFHPTCYLFYLLLTYENFMEAGTFVHFLSLCILNTQSNTWHRVDAQKIFVEWMNLRRKQFTNLRVAFGQIFSLSFVHFTHKNSKKGGCNSLLYCQR